MRPHTIDAMMRLAGRQDTAVTVNHAGTPEATVVVQLGRAVVYLHSMETADRFASIWQGAQRDAEQLPRSRNLDRGPRTGPLAIAEPSIVVDHEHPGPAALRGGGVRARGGEKRLQVGTTEAAVAARGVERREELAVSPLAHGGLRRPEKGGGLAEGKPLPADVRRLPCAAGLPLSVAWHWPQSKKLPNLDLSSRPYRESCTPG